jgi:hypothetical protein
LLRFAHIMELVIFILQMQNNILEITSNLPQKAAVSGFEYCTQAIRFLCPTVLFFLRPKHLLSSRTCFHPPQMSRRVIVFGQFLESPFITYIFRGRIGGRGNAGQRPFQQNRAGG